MMNKSVKGKFITFEGGEGCGKSTQSKRLVDYLLSKGIEVVLTREIGGTNEAEAIRALMLHSELFHMTELLLVMAARFEHIQRVILPALETGKWVICDRFIDSTACYQGQHPDIGIERVYSLHKELISPVMPDLTILFDLPVEVALQRAHERSGNNKFEEKDLGFHVQIRQCFLKLAESFPERIIKIDAESLSPDEIHAKILACLPSLH